MFGNKKLLSKRQYRRCKDSWLCISLGGQIVVDSTAKVNMQVQICEYLLFLFIPFKYDRWVGKKNQNILISLLKPRSEANIQ